MKKTLLFTLLFVPFIVDAQDDKSDFGIKFSGFVKNDFFYDTRQNATIREGHFLLYPLNENLDADKNDINAAPSLNFLSIQTRLTGKITGPDACGAKTSGVIEADFFGNENANFVDANGFRVRHAYAKLTWEKTEMLFGQYWHPMFIPGCFSGVISFNTGAPIQPFSRNPQIRVIHKIGKLNIMAAMSEQRDFTSIGGSTALRNSGIPDMHAQIYYNAKNEEKKTELLAGAGFGYKILKPALYTENSGKKYVTDETIGGMMGTAYVKYATEKFTCKLQGTYGQNLSDLTMLGGYVATRVTDTTKNFVEYTTINASSVWAEFQTNGKNLQFGLWAGYTANLGAKDSIMDYPTKIGLATTPIRGANINYIYRVAPRVVFIRNKFNFALEAEYTTASYLTKDDAGLMNINSQGQITASKDFSNIRLLFAVIYNF